MSGEWGGAVAQRLLVELTADGQRQGRQEILRDGEEASCLRPRTHRGCVSSVTENLVPGGRIVFNVCYFINAIFRTVWAFPVRSSHR